MDGALLAVSELVTNAGKFGNSDPIWLSLLVSPERLVVTWPAAATMAWRPRSPRAGRPGA